MARLEEIYAKGGPKKLKVKDLAPPVKKPVSSSVNIEETETVQLSITTGAEANVSSINGQVVEFSIENLTSGDLLMNMSWAPANELFDTSGTSYDAVDLADLILTLKDTSGNVLDSSDASGFESLTIAETDADGDYFVEASFFSVTDLGDSGYFDLNLNLMFSIRIFRRTYTLKSKALLFNSEIQLIHSIIWVL